MNANEKGVFVGGKLGRPKIFGFNLWVRFSGVGMEMGNLNNGPGQATGRVEEKGHLGSTWLIVSTWLSDKTTQ